MTHAPTPFSWYSYDVGGLPELGAVNATESAPSCAVTKVIDGESGTPTGVTGSDDTDAVPCPAVFTAET